MDAFASAIVAFNVIREFHPLSSGRRAKNISEPPDASHSEQRAPSAEGAYFLKKFN